MRTVWGQGGVFLLFVVIVLALTHPLAWRLTSGVVGSPEVGDVVAFVWNLWWTRFALFELGQNPFVTEMIFVPHTMDLRLHTFGPLYGILSVPPQLVWGPGGALNVMVLVTLVLNGFTVYRFAEEAIGSRDGALVAGVLVALGPAVNAHIRVGRPSIVAIWAAALALLFLRRLFVRGRRVDGLGLGVALLAALLLDLQVVLYSLLLLALYGAWLVWRYPSALRRGATWSALLVASLTFSVPFVTFYLPPLLAAQPPEYPVPSAEHTQHYSLWASLYVTPWFLTIQFGRVLPIAVAITVVGLFWSRRALPWLVIGIVFMLLSLGVVLTPTEIPLPYALLRRIPGAGQFRTPYRFTVPETIAMAIAVGATWGYWSARLAPRARTTLLALFMVLAILDARSVAPFELLAFPVPSLYYEIADHPATATLLEVPVGVSAGLGRFGQHETLQYYQTIHEKPTVSGHLTRVPRSVFAYYRASPALSFLGGEPVEAPERIEQDLATRLEALEVGWVLFHRDLLEPDHARAVQRLLDTHPALEFRAADGDLRLYVTRRVSEAK